MKLAVHTAAVLPAILLFFVVIEEANAGQKEQAHIRELLVLFKQAFVDETIQPRTLHNAQAEIAEYRAEALPPLIEFLTKEDAPSIYWLTNIFSMIGEESIKPLAEFIDNDDKEKRSVAVSAIAAIKGKQAVEPLIHALGDEEENLRCIAAEALGEMGDQRAFKPLMDLLGDEAKRVRCKACAALGELRNKDAVPSLEYHWSSDKEKEVRLAAAYSLVKIDNSNEAFEYLLAGLRDEDDTTGETAVQLLGKTKDKRAIEPLVVALKEQRFGFFPGQALARIGAPAIESLMNLLTDSSEDIRHEAEEALTVIGEPAVEMLITALRSENEDVRDSALHLLKRITKHDLGQDYWAWKNWQDNLKKQEEE